VLKAPDIPSILVETAFISNPEEEAKLRDPDYQAKLVDALAHRHPALLRAQPAAGAESRVMAHAARGRYGTTTQGAIHPAATS
jgi:hypothetical protein